MCDICLTDLEERRGENATCAGDTQLCQVVKCQAAGDKLREPLSRLCEWARALPRTRIGVGTYKVLHLAKITELYLEVGRGRNRMKGNTQRRDGLQRVISKPQAEVPPSSC